MNQINNQVGKTWEEVGKKKKKKKKKMVGKKTKIYLVDFAVQAERMKTSNRRKKKDNCEEEKKMRG